MPVSSGDFSLSYIEPTSLQASATFNAVSFGDVRFQYAGGAALAVTRSLDGTTYYPCKISDEAGNTYDSVTTAGIYYVDGGFMLKFSQAVTIAASA